MLSRLAVMKVAFIGLGNMGYPMAGHLSKAGHEVCVYNRTTSVAQKWVEQYGHNLATSPAEAARGCDFVAVCVGADDDVREVTTGASGAISAMEAGSVLVDHTTASAELARELNTVCRDAGIGFVDGPVSGGQSGAVNGVLSVMCGGSDTDFAKAQTYMSAYAKTITHVGDAGAGQLTKMCNQILCTGAIVGAAEALAFGRKAGLDMDKVLAAVTQGAAGSWYLSNRGHTMVADEFDFGFAVDWMAKDLGLVSSEATELHAEIPLTELAAKLLTAAQKAGDSNLDATAIIRQYR